MKLAFAAVLALGLLLGASTATPGLAAAASVAGSPGRCIRRLSTSAVNHASLVVKFGDGRALTFCIEFSEDSITGMQLLKRSGLPVITAASGGIGAAVCSIDGEGCIDPGNCFCHCTGGSCLYWVYLRYVSGAWEYSSVGAGSRVLRNGDSDAWVWGGAGATPGTSGVVCVAPVPTPSAAATVTPRPSATPVPILPTATATTAQAEPVATPDGAPLSTSSPNVDAQLGSATAEHAVPTSAVLAAAKTPDVRANSAPAPTVEVARLLPADPEPAGVVRITEAQGEHNQAGSGRGGDWRWGSILTFGGIAAVLSCAGGVVWWRRRAAL